MHTGLLVWAWRNHTPSEASRSALGESALSFPMNRSASQRSESVQKSNMLGRSAIYKVIARRLLFAFLVQL